jgi:HEAT repeat protein
MDAASQGMTRWGRTIGVRPGEGRTVVLVAALFAALEFGRGFGEIGVDTLVVKRFGAGSLPYLFIGLGTVSLVASLAYGAALGRLPRIRLFSGILIGASLALVLERLLIETGQAASLALAYLTVYAVGAIAVTIVWTMAASVFDARQARRLFPLCTAAAIAGSFVGTLLSGPTARALGTPSLLVVEAVLLTLVALLIVGVARITTVRVPPRQHDRSIVTDLRTGFDTVVRSPLMRLVAVAYVLLAILGSSVTYPFFQAASTTFTSEADLATALGLLSASVTATSFVVSLLVANRLYARIGVAGAAMALPVVYLGGFGIWIVAFSMATAALVRFVQQTTQRGLSNAAWSAFYNVVPSERRAQVLAFNDGVPGQLGTILSGVLLLAAGSVLARDEVFWLGALTALACTVVGIGIRRRYGSSLLQTLRAGLGEQVLEGGPGLAALTRDPAVATALITALEAPEPGVRRMAASLLGRTTAADAGPALVLAMTDEDAGVRAAALDAIAALGASAEVTRAVRERLRDPEPPVRAAAVRALTAIAVRADDPAGAVPAITVLADDHSPVVRAAVACSMLAGGPDETAMRIIEELLDDPDDDCRVAGLDAIRRLGDPLPLARVRPLLADRAARVRVAALRAVAVSSDADPVVGDLLAALDDRVSDVRVEAARILAAFETAPPGVVDVLATDSERAQAAALAALVGHGPEVRPQVLDWAGGRLTRANELRRARLALMAGDAADTAPGAGPETVFLASILRHREHDLANLALGALTVLGAPEAGGVIRRCLRSRDTETRAQAIEALESIGDPRLSGALVGLLDEAPATPQDRADALRRLADDDDPWIARMARTISTGGADMPETSRTLGDLETMLCLRRVPLFEGLGPEDLQRIASTAVEHVYPAGEALVREGDLGETLIVIVEGSVRVVRAEPDGSERLIRTYGVGDHIGELAVLREAPRAATVIAEDDGVRGLVIGGDGLKAILRERPDAAMAMLATLSERISRQ